MASSLAQRADRVRAADGHPFTIFESIAYAVGRSAVVLTRIALPSWIALSMAMSSTACHAFYAVSGRVVTCDTQAPIAGAEVQVNVPEIERKGKTTTDQQGEFRVAVNHPPADLASELSVSKPGYAASQHSVKDPEVPQQLCLKPAEPAR